MSKKSNERYEAEMEAKAVETAERKDDMNEKKEFFDEEKAMESDLENDQEMDSEEKADDSTEGGKELSEVPEKKGFFGKIFGGIKRWFAKRWKWLVGIGAVAIVGGIIYVYFQGKKVKVGTVEEVAEAIAETEGDNKKVLDFAEEAKKLAKDMVKNPENYEVTNF